MRDMDDATTKANRRKRMEPKAHRQVMSRPLGLPSWLRPMTKKRREKVRAIASKTAAKRG